MTEKRKYWIQALVWLGLVYGSIPVVRPICEFLKTAAPLSLIINGMIIGILIYFSLYLIKNTKLDRTNAILLLVLIMLYALGLREIKIVEERIHFIQYGVLAFLLNRALWADYKGIRAFAIAFALTSLLGWGDELIQHITPERYYDNKDVILNSVSGALGLLLDFIRRRS